jgi:hypothetical protein
MRECELERNEPERSAAGGLRVDGAWLSDRAAGKPLESTFNLVDSTGQMHIEPRGENRVYDMAQP